jgi:hypothetical protein
MLDRPRHQGRHCQQHTILLRDSSLIAASGLSLSDEVTDEESGKINLFGGPEVIAESDGYSGPGAS